MQLDPHAAIEHERDKLLEVLREIRSEVFLPANFPQGLSHAESRKRIQVAYELAHKTIKERE